MARLALRRPGRVGTAVERSAMPRRLRAAGRPADDHLRVEISHSHPSLCEGFHDDEEGARRWTTGMGRVPECFQRAFAGGLIIEVHCLPAMPRYPLHPQIVAIPE